MANLNKVFLICRATRDPEVKQFANGGKVAKIGVAVNNSRKNRDTGKWEDDPVFLNVEVFNRGEHGKLADLCEEYIRKGHQFFVEGKLQLDQWTAQDGSKRSQIKVVAESIQFLEPRGKSSEGVSADISKHTDDGSFFASESIPF